MRVRELCGQYLTDRVLVGLPRTLGGEEGFQAQRVREFARRIELFGLNVRFWDERLTTRSATRALIEGRMRREKRRDVVDMPVSYTHLDVYKRQRAYRAVGRPCSAPTP